MVKSIEKLENDKKEFIKSLSIKELKAYIDNLIKIYYDSYISDDADALKNTIEEINLFIDDFNSLYPNIANYINSRMLNMSNKYLEEIFKRNLKLFYPEDVDIRGDSGHLRSLFDEELMKKIVEEEENYYCKRCKGYKLKHS